MDSSQSLMGAGGGAGLVDDSGRRDGRGGCETGGGGGGAGAGAGASRREETEEEWRARRHAEEKPWDYSGVNNVLRQLHMERARTRRRAPDGASEAGTSLSELAPDYPDFDESL